MRASINTLAALCAALVLVCAKTTTSQPGNNRFIPQHFNQLVPHLCYPYQLGTGL